MLKTWHKIILSQSNSISEAIENINNNSYGIVLVTDNKNKLIGTITDGDIRRGFMNHISIDAPIKIIMCKNPHTAFYNSSDKDILNLFSKHGIMHLPLIDEKNQIIDVKTLKNIFLKNKYDNPVFIMAGGFGKRLQPLTNLTPKPMLNINGKPILEIILSQFIEHNFNNFYISTYYKSEKIKNYFKNGEVLNVSIKYIDEKKPLGTAGALRLLPFKSFSSPIIMMNGDLITKVNIENFLKYHYENQNDITIGATKYEFEVPYGVIDTQDNNFKSIIEKPKRNFFINAGIYIIEPNIVETIEKGQAIDMPTWINRMTSNNVKINIFPIFEYWVDIGNKSELDKVKREIS